MKHHFLLLALLALPALAAAQCYTVHRDAGKRLMAEKKYDEAIVRFSVAKKCSADKPADGNKQMDALIAEAEKLKNLPVPPKTTSNLTIKNQPTEPEMVFVTGGAACDCPPVERTGFCEMTKGREGT